MADPARHALAGTARLRGAPETGTDAEQWLVGDAEAHVLRALAVHAVTQAARVPQRRPPLEPPVETTSVLPSAAADALDACLADRDLVAPLLDVVARRGFTLPAAFAPRLDPPAPALLSDHARWLYTRMGRLTPPPADVWLDGTRAQRLDWLTERRRSAPAEAREAVVTVFAREPAELRAAMVATFALGLGPDDQPFLDGCLADRAASVRRAAMVVLAPTPAMRVRLLACVGPLVARGFALPDPLPADWIGAEGATGQERLRALVSLIDPTAWPDLAAMVRDKAWGDVLRPALVDATVLHRAPVAGRLFAGVPDPRLLPLLADPDAAVQPFVALRNDVSAELLRALPAPWSVALGRLVIANLALAAARSAAWPQAPAVLAKAKVALPVSLVEEVAAIPPLARLAEALRLRSRFERTLDGLPA